MIQSSKLLPFGFLVLHVALGLVPQKFWNNRHLSRLNSEIVTKSKKGRASQKGSFLMYFDDCERRWLTETWGTWPPMFQSMITDTKRSTTRSESKKQAMDRLLGYNADSMASLSAEEIEDETLQWALDNNVIWAGDDDQDDNELQEFDGESGPKLQKGITSKYESISDLIVASECRTTADALAFLWELFARLMNNQELNNVYMVVFPNVSAMWQYDVMVTVLQALKISRPLLPAQMQNFQLDLFHPRYKHSPRFLSPAMHSPFPTIGLSIQSSPSPRSQSLPLLETPDDNEVANDLDATRLRLEALFASLDADDRVVKRLSAKNMDTKNILAACKRWFVSRNDIQKDSKVEWLIEMAKEPFQVYPKVWSAISQLQALPYDQETKSTSTRMIVAPQLDFHTTKRIAITVSAALRRLESPIRIVDIFHPSSSSKSRISPFPMIQLQYTTTFHNNSENV